MVHLCRIVTYGYRIVYNEPLFLCHSDLLDTKYYISFIFAQLHFTQRCRAILFSTLEKRNLSDRDNTLLGQQMRLCPSIVCRVHTNCITRLI